MRAVVIGMSWLEANRLAAAMARGVGPTSIFPEITPVAALSFNNRPLPSKETYAAAGWKGVWQKEIDWAQEDSKSRYVSPFSMAYFYNSLGDKNRAIEQLNKAFEERNGSLVTLKSDPGWDNLRGDARFQDLLRRIGLPQ